MANKQILEIIAKADVNLIMDKDATYKGSWKKRGGVGAYFTLIRPIDRFIAIAEAPRYSPHKNSPPGTPLQEAIPAYDIFKMLEADDADGTIGKDGTLLACIRDIRCYLMLVEAEIIERTQASNYGLPHQCGTTITPHTGLYQEPCKRTV